MVCKEGCNCWKCYFEGLTLDDDAITAGAVVATAALIGWGMSSLFSSSSSSSSTAGSSSRSTTTYTYDDDEEDNYVTVAAKGSAAQDYFKDDFHKPQPPWKATIGGITRKRSNEETYIMNCDASDKPNLGGYYGVLIRDSRGEVIAAAVGRSERVDITVHELQGLEIGLKLAKSYGIRRIIVRTDSQTVVNILKINNPPPKVAVNVWNRILQMVDQLEDFDINHINRDDNRAANELVKFAANELAKLCPNTEYVDISPSDFPERLKKIINEEKMSLFNNQRTTYIINCDGSDKPHIGAGYYGALIRDSRGEVIAAAIGRSERVNVTVHELEGLETGLKLAKSYGIGRIIVRTDSRTVVNLFVEKNPPPKVAVNVWNRIQPMVNQLESFKINHINRGANRAADELAKLCPVTEYMEISPSDFPERLKKIINDDKMSLFY